MAISDSSFLHERPPAAPIIFAASQLQGGRETQEDYFINFNDECFVVCDGVGGLPQGEVASQLAGDTAVWAYRLVRQKHTYWKDRKLLLQRIFRTTNMSVWQKQREEGFGGGMGTTMLVCIIIDRHFYIGSVGDSSAYLVRGGVMTKLTTEDVDASGSLTKAIGTTRYGLIPSVVTGDFIAGDSLIMVTDGVGQVMNTIKCSELLKQSEISATELSNVAATILHCAQDSGVTDNMTVCLMKRI
ncbi:MAG: protein phosphatase 2C domain-containing protein [Candidatus Gottesmanbacteria bacterium]|nr:protein phosphatase 2C domain-containing protein [Candidatus Gottesmanbacteria bacterium]